MQLLRRRAYGRAGLIGNPSDGYFGKTMAISLRNYWAEVVLYDWHELEIILSQEDRSRFRSIHELRRDVELHGYYGGVRLVKATIKKFVEYCDRRSIRLHDQNFAIRYSSNIPRQVGMAGSSAIIVATLRCLMDYYQVEVNRRVQPSLALSVENEELGIGAGLQDRVVQVYEGLVDMDFTLDAGRKIEGYHCGRYRRLDDAWLPRLYVAYSTDFSEPTEVFHNNLRERFNAGEVEVVGAMKRFAALTDEAREAIEQRDQAKLEAAINANFDLRQKICRLNPSHVRMVELARSVGASAKFSGSGGAIIGVCDTPEKYCALSEVLGEIGCVVFRPQISNRAGYPEWLDE